VDGTSFSSPFAAGLAALYIARRRKQLSNPIFRPSRSEVVNVLSGESFLDTADLSYPAFTPTVSAGGAGIAFVLVVVLILLFLIFSGSRTKNVRYIV
jgi:subtilisin family serine protease